MWNDKPENCRKHLQLSDTTTSQLIHGQKINIDVSGDTAPIQGPVAQLLRAGLCFDRRAECNADSCFNFQPDADITHTEPETQEREPGTGPRLSGLRGRVGRGRALAEAPLGDWGHGYPEGLRVPGRGEGPTGRASGRHTPERCFWQGSKVTSQGSAGAP